MWLPSCTSSASWSTVSWYLNPIFLNLQSSLMSLLSYYFHVAPRVLPDPFGPLSAELSPSAIAEANAAVNGVQQAKTQGSKKQGTCSTGRLIVLRIARVRIRYQIFGRGMFIQELHPLLPGEQLALWAKLNSAKFLCQYKAWTLSEIFIQQKFCAIR